MIPKPFEFGYSHVQPAWNHSIVFPPILEALKSVPSDGAILDIGCGNGAMLAEIQKRGT